MNRAQASYRVTEVLDKRWNPSGIAEYLVKGKNGEETEWIPLNSPHEPRFPGWSDINELILRFELTWNPTRYDAQSSSGHDKFLQHEEIFDEYGHPSFVCGLSSLPEDVRSRRRNGHVCVRRVGERGVDYRWVAVAKCVPKSQVKENPMFERKDWKYLRKIQQASLLHPVITGLDIDRTAFLKNVPRPPRDLIKREEQSSIRKGEFCKSQFVSLQGENILIGCKTGLPAGILDGIEDSLTGLYREIQEELAKRLDEKNYRVSLPAGSLERCEGLFAMLLLLREHVSIIENFTKTLQYIFIVPLSLYFAQERVENASNQNLIAFLINIIPPVVAQLQSPKLKRGNEMFDFLRISLEYSISLNRIWPSFVDLHPYFHHALDILNQSALNEKPRERVTNYDAALCSLFCGFSSRKYTDLPYQLPCTAPLKDPARLDRKVREATLIDVEGEHGLEKFDQNAKGEFPARDRNVRKEDIRILRHQSRPRATRFVLGAISGWWEGAQLRAEWKEVEEMHSEALQEYWESRVPNFKDRERLKRLPGLF